MDFFEHQDAARKSSRRLVWLFSAAVGAILLVVASIGAAWALLSGPTHGLNQPSALTVVTAAGVSAAVTLAMIVCGTLYKTSQLAGGGAVVAGSLGGTLVEPDATDPHVRRLLNVVEEMAIATGCPVPAVFLLEDEEGINAFAAGWSLDDAVIGVTHGAVHRLTRDELQGVVAHEFSHILHGDMRLNLRLTGLVFGILALSVTGAVILRFFGHTMTRRRYHRRDRNDSESGVIALIALFFLIGIVLYVVGSLGVFFARLIQAAVSRQREFLADASAVQYTRNPDGIGHALLKIGGLAQGSGLQSAHASELRHLFFGVPSGSGGRAFLGAGLATHPPLTDRIARLLPAWEGRWRDPDPRHARPEHDRPRAATPGVAALAGAPATALTDADPAPRADPASRPALGFIGEPTGAHVQRARELIAALPPRLVQAARTRAGAQAVVFALLGDRRDPAVARAQAAYLTQHVGSAAAELTARMSAAVADLEPALRLPLLDLTLPALKALHPRDQRAFEAHLDELIGADDRLELFEWALRQALWRHLIGPEAARVRRTARLADHRGDLAVLLSVLSRFNATGEAAGRAFAAGAEVVGGLSAEAASDAQIGTARLTDAVDRLGTLTPADTRTVVHACAAAIASDGRVTVREFELLRAVAETLDVPVPPLLPGQRLG